MDIRMVCASERLSSRDKWMNERVELLCVRFECDSGRLWGVFLDKGGEERVCAMPGPLGKFILKTLLSLSRALTHTRIV